MIYFYEPTRIRITVLRRMKSKGGGKDSPSLFAGLMQELQPMVGIASPEGKFRHEQRYSGISGTILTVFWELKFWTLVGPVRPRTDGTVPTLGRLNSFSRLSIRY